MIDLASRLHSIAENAMKDFRLKAQNEIKARQYVIASPSNNKTVNVSPNQIRNALRKICPSDLQQFRHDLVGHFEEVRGLIPFCSLPSAFRTAWGLRSELLNPWDANTIVEQGGQLVPLNRNSRIFQCIQQGVELGRNQRLILAVRHSEGNYEDKMDDLGRFTYQPPNNTAGMLRYRWCQFLSYAMKIPYILIAVMWFKLSQPVNENLAHVFVIAPAKIIDYSGDLQNLNLSLSNPLQLQIINRTDTLSILNLIFSLNETNLEIETRHELPEQLAREWSYDKINNTEKGRRIKRWAQKTGKKCPGTLCKKGTHPNIDFQDIPLSEIAFGHIISKNWAKAYTYMLEKVDHPDNLYLTCRSCNSSLGDTFPDKDFRERIVQNGTIGDWLRTSEIEIRGSK